MSKKSEFEQKAEAWGKNVEEEWSSGKRGKNAEYVANIVANVILLAIWHRLPEWLPFIKDSFAAVLPLFYISFSATIVANLIFLCFRQINLVSALKAALNIISLVMMISLYYIYPFNFSAFAGYWDVVAKIIIIVSIFGTAIAAVVEISRMIFSSDKQK